MTEAGDLVEEVVDDGDEAVAADLVRGEVALQSERALIGPPELLDQPVGALPSLIYIWENASERAFHERTAAAIIVLLVFMIIMNAAAIILRRRFERRW